MMDIEKRDEDSARVLDDFSCYINLKNNSQYDFLLADFGTAGGNSGKWPLYQPVNTLESGNVQTVHLKDQIGPYGTDGWVQYEVTVGSWTGVFKLNFADPYSIFSKNYIRSWSSDSNRIRVDVGNYSTSGHPFSVSVQVSVNPSVPAGIATSEPLSSSRQAQTTARSCNTINQTSDDTGMHANFDIGFQDIKKPIHESIAIAAFLRSRVTFPKATTYNNLNRKQWEFFRGMIWNDDPSCLLFDESQDDNRNFGLGAEWGYQFKFGKPGCMTQRSHFGDLQFLHSMASRKGEDPKVTVDNILQWMGIMYRLACGNQGVHESQPLKEHFGSRFDGMDPSRDATLRQMILATTPGYKGTNIQRRALGICMHMIEDSYALGHVSRRLTNPQDFAGRGSEERYLLFKNGSWGRWGPIYRFHAYGADQDSDRHTYYDGVEDGSVPNPRDLNSFNRLQGARDAIDNCIVLINAFEQKKPWDALRADLERTVYRLDDKVQVSDNGVDRFIPGIDDTHTGANQPEISAKQQQDMLGGYARGLNKLSVLESGLHAELSSLTGHVPSIRKHTRLGWALLLCSVIGCAVVIAARCYRLLGAWY